MEKLQRNTLGKLNKCKTIEIKILLQERNEENFKKYKYLERKKELKVKKKDNESPKEKERN